jgi:hypothetical protein
METKKRGGKRENSGRNPVSDPKIPITVYIEKSRVAKDGGKKGTQQKLLNYYYSQNVSRETV